MATPSHKTSWARAGTADIVRRIWSNDDSLWVEPSPGGEGDWLGWLGLPAALQRGIGVANAEQRAYFNEISSLNILGMGGSSLTPLVLSHLFPESNPRLNVFDTVNPDFISDAIDSLDLQSAGFAVASKSGTTVEPLALESVFRAALNDHGVEQASARFLALSDAGTPLADRASTGDFSIHLATPKNVGGRFSALSAFGMFPASVCGLPIDTMTASALEMSERCQIEDGSNPGIELGLFMARNALMGRDKVTFSMSPSLERFGLWLEQLLAESTGKNGRGLIPVVGEPSMSPEAYGDDRQFIRISLSGESSSEHSVFDLHPSYSIELPDRASITGEFFRWEFATAVAACAIGVYPFDQPDVESAKQLARQMLGAKDQYDDDRADLSDVIGKILASARSGDYIAIVAFLPESDALTAAVSQLRAAISISTGVATTFGYGPRYLHSTGQLHKGGPNSVILLALTYEPAIDIEVPGKSYSLAQLLKAQAKGDVQACLDKGRRANLVNLGPDPVGEIVSIAAELSSTTSEYKVTL